MCVTQNPGLQESQDIGWERTPTHTDDDGHETTTRTDTEITLHSILNQPKGRKFFLILFEDL